MNQMMPYHVRIVVPIKERDDLKERDDQFMRLQEVIEAKKQMLIDKQKTSFYNTAK